MISRWTRSLLLLAMIARAATSTAGADPWPVKLDDNDKDLVTARDLRTEVRPKTAPDVLDVTIQVLRQPIPERQFVQATLGEPRGRRGKPPPTYLHNGVDIRAASFFRIPRLVTFTTPAQVFTMREGLLRAYDDHTGTGAKITDYESLLIGDDRYMHIEVEPREFKEACIRYRLLDRPLLLPAGTRLGRAKETENFDAHLHLQREPIQDRVYTNPLPHLERWSDGTKSVFEPGVPDPDNLDPSWNLAPVRFVREFLPLAQVSPQPFPNVPSASGSAVPLLSGRVDILARIKDGTRDPAAPAGDRQGGSAAVAPAQIGFEVLRDPEADLERRGGVAVPMDLRLDFGSMGIPFGKDPDREKDRLPEAIASESFFHRVYWVKGDAGTVIVEKGRVKTMDYVVTNRAQPGPTEGAPPPPASQTEYWDTDVSATRNGIYQVRVVARDVPGQVAGQPAPPNEASENRKVMLCNPARITGAFDDVTGNRELSWRQHVLLKGENFFTPLSLPSRVPPSVRLYHSSTNVTDAVPIEHEPPIGGRLLDLRGNNDSGQFLFLLPQRPLGVRSQVYASVEIACDPGGEPSRGPLHRLAIIAEERYLVAYADRESPDSEMIRIQLFDSATGQTRTIATRSGPVHGVSLSGDGRWVLVHEDRGFELVSVANGTHISIEAPTNGARPPAVNHDATRVAYTLVDHASRGTEVRIVEISPGSGTVVSTRTLYRPGDLPGACGESLHGGPAITSKGDQVATMVMRLPPPCDPGNGNGGFDDGEELTNNPTRLGVVKISALTGEAMLGDLHGAYPQSQSVPQFGGFMMYLTDPGSIGVSVFSDSEGTSAYTLYPRVIASSGDVIRLETLGPLADSNVVGLSETAAGLRALLFKSGDFDRRRHTLHVLDLLPDRPLRTLGEELGFNDGAALSRDGRFVVITRSSFGRTPEGREFVLDDIEVVDLSRPSPDNRTTVATRVLGSRLGALAAGQLLGTPITGNLGSPPVAVVTVAVD